MEAGLLPQADKNNNAEAEALVARMQLEFKIAH
jgi:hypothetical protein